jgi:hypothetical protein
MFIPGQSLRRTEVPINIREYLLYKQNFLSFKDCFSNVGKETQAEFRLIFLEYKNSYSS